MAKLAITAVVRLPRAARRKSSSNLFMGNHRNFFA
jgi:hypothetical protein